jgi:Phospholipase_D-nuclease N-terminal/Short C-terminal domain
VIRAPPGPAAGVIRAPARPADRIAFATVPPLASTYTFGDALLTVLEFAILFLWIWVAVGVVFDIFRSRDLSNWAKALWILFIIVLPFIGVLAYLLVRGHTLHEHQEQDRAQAEAFQRFQASGGASASGVDELAKLSELHDRGKLSDAEFEQAKRKLLG